MKLQVNKRKVIAIGAMGLLLGSAVIPATVSAAESVAPTSSTVKVTNPGNIVNDANTFYDKYEWYGGDYSNPSCISNGAFESGHYKEAFTDQVDYSFEVKNDTDHMVSFLPAEDMKDALDLIWNNADGKWYHAYENKAIPMKVKPHSSRSVTVKTFAYTGVSIHSERGLYIYLLGAEGENNWADFGKNASTEGISYRIYKGLEKAHTTPKNELNYQIVSDNKDGNSYLNAHNDTANGHKYNVDGVVDLELDGRVDDKYLYNFPNTLLDPFKLANTFKLAQTNATAGELAWSDVREGHPFSSMGIGGNLNAPWIRGEATEYPAPYEVHHYLRVKLDKLQIPENSTYVKYTFKASDGVFLRDTTLKIPVSWAHVNDK